MTELQHTTPNNTTEQPDAWSAEAKEARDQASRPTAEDPFLFDIEDAVKLVSFEQIAGEKLSGSVVGYFYNSSGEKVNIVAPSRRSRELLEARGGTTSDGLMRVPESAVGERQLERATEAHEAEQGQETMVLREEAAEDLGNEALDAVEVAEPATGEYDHLWSDDYEPSENVADAAVISAEEAENRQIEAMRNANLEAMRNQAYANKENWRAIK